jgi:sugar lactone lactonase YvrE
MGIAWERANIYWTFDGKTQSITRANFMQDHGIGYDDHSDGRMQRFVEGEVRRVPNVPSHMVYDGQTDLLYVADTGNRRVAVLDTTEARSAGRIETIEPGTVLWRMQDATLTALADASTAGLERPSGLALHDDLLYVTDNATARITALTLDGAVVDWLDTGLEPGALMGIELDAAGRVYIVDSIGDRVLRFTHR